MIITRQDRLQNKKGETNFSSTCQVPQSNKQHLTVSGIEDRRSLRPGVISKDTEHCPIALGRFSVSETDALQMPCQGLKPD